MSSLQNFGILKLGDLGNILRDDGSTVRDSSKNTRKSPVPGLERSQTSVDRSTRSHVDRERERERPSRASLERDSYHSQSMRRLVSQRSNTEQSPSSSSVRTRRSSVTESSPYASSAASPSSRNWVASGSNASSEKRTPLRQLSAQRNLTDQFSSSLERETPSTRPSSGGTRSTRGNIGGTTGGSNIRRNVAPETQKKEELDEWLLSWAEIEGVSMIVDIPLKFPPSIDQFLIRGV